MAGTMATTSADSNQTSPPFFSKIYNNNSFSELLNGVGAEEAGYVGDGLPRFKSTPPPSLPISQPSIFSPSNYFAIPAGLSPAELLDSPVLHAHSHVLPSPTTGAFSAEQSYNWKSNSSIDQRHRLMKNEDEDVESSFFSDFAFHPNPSTVDQQQQQQQKKKEEEEGWTKVERPSSEYYSNQRLEQNQITMRRNNKSDDGYNWRKYGQKQVKGNENPRSYYKCSNPNCPTKKIVEIAIDGRITEIVYKGVHNHPKPQSTRKNSSSSYHPYSQNLQSSSMTLQQQQQQASENSSVSVDDESEGRLCFEEPSSKRGKSEFDSGDRGVVTMNKTVKEARVVVQTTSDIDILDDGYRWRKYGQKVVKGNSNPRSYYKCTSLGCLVRKQVERSAHDASAVITTYEGKHLHDVPVARGGGSLSNKQNPLQNYGFSGYY